MSDLLLAVIGQGIINVILVAGIVVMRNRRDDSEQKSKESKHRSDREDIDPIFNAGFEDIRKTIRHGGDPIGW